MTLFEQEWSAHSIAWGETKCGVKHCLRRAEVLLDRHARCIECADDECDRFVAVSIEPRLRDLLPPLVER